MMMTDEQKNRAAEKRRATAERKRQHKQALKAEREAQLDALRRVRDNPDAGPADVLRAVELLDKLTPKY